MHSSRSIPHLKLPGAVSLRRLRREDIPALRDGFASGVAAETTHWIFPRSLPSMLGWFDEVSTEKANDLFTILVGRESVGTCGLRTPRFAGRELTIAIFEPRFRGRGVGTVAVRRLCEFGFRSRGLHRIELGVYPTNRRAIACYARCGFQYEALLRKFVYHDGKWVDIMWMSQLRN
jgi:RimJ/RimL family protein N-acetyltransferase